MGFLNVLRATAFGITFFFSIIIVAFNAFRLAKFQLTPFGQIVTGLTMTASILNILIVITTFLLEMIIKSGKTSLVPIELGRTGILWILWLAAFAEEYSRGAVVASDCAGLTGYPEFQADCAYAIFGPILAIFNFLLLFAWFMTVLTLSALGNHWMSPVHKFDLTKKRAVILEAQARQPNTSPYFSGKTPGPGGYYPPQQGYYPQSPPQQPFAPGPQQQGYWVPAQQMQNHQPPQVYWVVPGPAAPGTPQAGGSQAQAWPQQSPPQQPTQEAQSPPMPPSKGEEQGTHNAEGAIAQ